MKRDGLPLGYFQITDAYTPASGAGGGPRCAIEVLGTNGRDTPATVPGSGSGDRLVGARGADRLRGLAGDDCLLGQGGGDRLDGGAGKDRIVGESGNDRIRAADGERDRVSCGAGKRDRAVVDRRDRVSGCERVRRKKP
jgi:Ca2+-binding RTX toxin-like protein